MKKKQRNTLYYESDKVNVNVFQVGPLSDENWPALAEVTEVNYKRVRFWAVLGKCWDIKDCSKMIMLASAWKRYLKVRN